MTGPLRPFGGGTFGAGTFGGVTVTTDPRWFLLIPDAAGNLVDVGCDARRVSIAAGRSSYVQAFTAATLTVELANFTGRYSTWPPDSVWRTPDGFVTGVPIKMGVAHLGGVRYLFVGTTDSVSDTFPGFADAVATVQATDGMKGLARHDGGPRAPVGANELSGARVGRLAADAAWSGPLALDAGLVAMQATDLSGLTLDLMHRVGEAEWGWLFVASDGTLTFRQRDAYLNDPRMSTVQYTFTDTHALPGACYGDATVLAADESTVVNTALVTPPGHATSTFSDAASVAHYGPRTWSKTDLPIANDVDAVALAQAVVLAYKADAQRIDAVTIDAANRSAAWPAAVGCRISDRIRFVRTLAGGWQVDAELLVQGRRDEMVPAGLDGSLQEWTVTFSTASAAYVAGLGRWDDPASSTAGWDVSQWGA